MVQRLFNTIVQSKYWFVSYFSRKWRWAKTPPNFRCITTTASVLSAKNKVWKTSTTDITRKVNPRPRFTSVLEEILSYEEILTHKLYLILRNLEWVSSSNNTIKCISNRARCVLIQNFLELYQICGLKLLRKISSLVKHWCIQPLDCNSGKFCKQCDKWRRPLYPSKERDRAKEKISGILLR